MTADYGMLPCSICGGRGVLDAYICDEPVGEVECPRCGALFPKAPPPIDGSGA